MKVKNIFEMKREAVAYLEARGWKQYGEHEGDVFFERNAPVTDWERNQRRAVIPDGCHWRIVDRDLLPSAPSGL